MTAVQPAQKGGFRRWVPKKWTPVYTQIVVLSAAGSSNIDIAKYFNYTTQQISNILCTPQARLMRRELVDKIKERAYERIPDQLDAVAVKAAQRIKECIEDDDLFEKSPFAVVDRSLKVLQATGHIRSETSPAKERTLVVTAEDMKRLVDGMERSDELRKALPPARDVDFQVLKDGTRG